MYLVAGLGFVMAILICDVGFALLYGTQFKFCIFVCALLLLIIPFGTVLGAVTLVFLLREDSRDHFGHIQILEPAD